MFFFDREFLDDGEELVPIIKTNTEGLKRDFYNRSENNNQSEDQSFNSKALIIINQD